MTDKVEEDKKSKSKVNKKSKSVTNCHQLKKKAEQKPRRRRRQHSISTFEEIIDMLCEGRSLRSVLRLPQYDIAMKVFYEHLDRYESLSKRYARACEIRTQLLIDDIIDIADNTYDPQKARLQIDARKWFACKLLPKQYGEKIQHSIDSNDKINVNFNLGKKDK